jgi:hypothetical protein
MPEIGWERAVVGEKLLSLWKGDAAREVEAFEKVPRFC